MKWKCLLVDDEPPALNILEKYIALIEQLEVVDKCSNAFQAMEVLQKKKVDLIFLDIQMPKLSGTGFLNTLKNPPKVIFTTAFKEYASEAFDLDAVDYLVKPVSLERFIKAVNKVTQANNFIEEKPIATAETTGFLYFRADRKMVKVFLDDIVYVESLKDYIKIYRKNEKPLMVKQSIGTLEAMLPEHLFLRVHRSFVVAINKITAFTNHDVEVGEMVIPIGRQYAARLQQFPGFKK
ncbi:LytR/AlgR family response regulator transcription factor [Ferruginibacter sp. SUN106]|uniref:LytR/AlgR family response regulator transcription factor n=1 Tax=Ferruginibacter sp. SUN106 TaxID=2978348 RepID=UPI003D35BF30